MKGRMARFKFWSIISARRPTGLAVGGTVVLSGVLTAALVITLGCGNTAKTVPGPAALSSSPTPVCGNSVLLSGPATAPAGAVIVSVPSSLVPLMVVAALIVWLPQINSPALGTSGPRDIFSNSNSVMGRSAAQSKNAARSIQLK